MSRHQNFSQKFWEDKHGRVVVWQTPNVWLIGWFITMVANWFMPLGVIHDTVGWISLGLLVIWALLEVTKGVNYFRRLLGILVILALIFPRILGL